MSDPDPDPLGSSTNAAYAETVPAGTANGPPGTRGFFEKVRDVVGERWLKEFHLDTFRKQDPEVRILGEQETQCRTSRESMHWLESRAGEKSTSTATGRPERVVIIAEDMSAAWIERLDAAFGIDPLFVLAYAWGKYNRPQLMGKRLREHSHPLMISGNSFSDSIKGHWAMTQFFLRIERSEWSELITTRATHSWWYQRFDKHRWQGNYAINLALGLCQLDESTYLVALDSSPNARFPRGRNLHGLAGRIQMPDYGMPWSLKDFPKGPWIDKLNCLTKTFMAAVSDKSRDFAFDLTFGARPTLNIQQPSESLWGPERVMESRIQMLMQFSWHFAWAENVAFLRRKLEHQRYEALLSPSAATYRPLITLRRAIAGTRSGIVALQNSIQPGMEEAFQRMHGDSERTLRGMYEPLLKQIDDINRELNEDIQLIIGAVTIQDSEAMKLQAERATLLTLLAAIYLPLTLVTGIFGMNIQEINGGIPSFKACLEALAVAAVITGIFVFSYSCWRRWRKTQEQQRQEQEVTEHRDLAALFERRSGHPREDGSVKFGTVVKVLKRGWERTKDALSRMVRRKRQASPGASNELGERG